MLLPLRVGFLTPHGLVVRLDHGDKAERVHDGELEPVCNGVCHDEPEEAERGEESTNAGFFLTAPARLDQAGIPVPSVEVQVG